MQLASYLKANVNHANAISYFCYTIIIMLAARINTYDRHNKKHCTCNKINYKKLKHVRSYYEILINAKSLQYFMALLLQNPYRTISFSFKFVKLEI